jgi:hypothetical protein
MRSSLVLAASAPFVLALSPALAQPVFRYVTGTTSHVGGIIPGLSDAPALDNGVIAFLGQFDGVGFEGVYTFNELTRFQTEVCRRGDPLPDRPGQFGSLQSPISLSGGEVAFHAFTSLGRAVYSNSGGPLRLIAGTGVGYRARDPSLHNGTVTFMEDIGATPGPRIKHWSAATGLTTLVDLNTPVPNRPGYTMAQFNYWSVTNNGRVAFVAHGYPGVYLSNYSGTEIRAVVDSDTPVPGGTGTFGYFPQLTLALDSDGTVVFAAPSGTSQLGIYANPDGLLRRVADLSTPIPGGNGSFTDFHYASISAGNIAFVGLGSNGQKGIFGTVVGELGSSPLQRFIGVGDTLDGRTVADLTFGTESLSGHHLAFAVRFTDNTRAIYAATIPAPGTLVLLATLARASRRRSRCSGPLRCKNGP